MQRPSIVLMVGYGSVGQALTPLLLQHFDLQPTQILVMAADENGRKIAAAYGLRYDNFPLRSDNYAAALAGRLGAGDWLINVAVEVSSLALVRWCRERAVLYLDTGVEPWAHGYGVAAKKIAPTNYALRQQILSEHVAGASTAVVAHGANPGLASHFVKAGLLELAKLRSIKRWSGWGDLARQLNIKAIQIAERDTQEANLSLRPGEFFNTWSVDGFIAEAWQLSELGWGSHERQLPDNGYRHGYGDRAGIYLGAHSAEVTVKSWVPGSGEQQAYLIAHHEALSIANLLTITGDARDQPVYRPTVYYAYRPAPLTCQSLAQWIDGGYGQPQRRYVMQEILERGVNQLGALLVFPGGCYWYGSTLSLTQARRWVPHGNATSVQVAAGVLGGLAWLCNHPRQGVVEAESMDFAAVMRVAAPYLGDLSGTLSNWQPNNDASLQFAAFVVPNSKSKIASQTTPRIISKNNKLASTEITHSANPQDRMLRHA